MPAYSDYIVLVRDSFNILRVDETGTKSLSTETYPRPEAAAMALHQGVLHHFKPLDGDMATMVGAPYFYVNTRKMGHIWFGRQFLCGPKPIRSTAGFSHHRPDFLCVDCMQKLRTRSKLFEAVFDQIAATTKPEPDPSSSASSVRCTVGTFVWSPTIRREEVGLDEQHLPGGVLLFWAKGIKSCVILRRRFWPVFVRRVLDSLAAGSDLGMSVSIFRFLTQVREHNIPFEQIRITVLDQMSTEDPRYPHGDKPWCALLSNVGYEPENSHTRIMMPLIRDKEGYWIPKAQIDGTSVERLSMTVSEWKAFFERSDWKFNLPLAMGGYEKIDEQAFASSGLVTTNEDYVLQYMDILSAVSKGNIWEFRLSTSNGEYANKYTVTSLASAWSMLGTMRRKGVVRWAYWVKLSEA